MSQTSPASIPVTAIPTIRAQEVREAFAKYQEDAKEYIAIREERVIKPLLAGNREAALTGAKEAAPKFRAALDALNHTITVKEGIAKKKYEEAQAVYTSSRVTMIGLVIVAVLMGLALGYFIASLVADALKQVMVATQQAASGDLTVRVAVDTKDELGLMGTALNQMLDSFHDSMAQVQQAANHTASAAQQLAAGSEQLSSGAQEQAASLEETAASLEQMTSTVKRNADNARQANQMSVSARAGEQGRGFAVVASEVRALAQRSAAASKEIKTLITDSVAKVEDGGRMVNQSGDTLTEIVTSVKKVADLIAEISAVSQEQAQGIELVNMAVTQMDSVTQSNAAQTEELSSTAQSLAAQAEELANQVAKFKLAGAVVSDQPSTGSLQPKTFSKGRPPEGQGEE